MKTMSHSSSPCKQINTLTLHSSGEPQAQGDSSSVVFNFFILQFPKEVVFESQKSFFLFDF